MQSVENNRSILKACWSNVGWLPDCLWLVCCLDQAAHSRWDSDSTHPSSQVSRPGRSWLNTTLLAVVNASQIVTQHNSHSSCACQSDVDSRSFHSGCGCSSEESLFVVIICLASNLWMWCLPLSTAWCRQYCLHLVLDHGHHHIEVDEEDRQTCAVSQ